MNKVRFPCLILMFFLVLCSPSGETTSLATNSYPLLAGLLPPRYVTSGLAGAASSMSVTVNSLSVDTVAGLNAPPQTFEVWSSGGEPLNYSITVDQVWLKCFPASGTSTGEHDSITVSYSTESLSIGTYAATLTISAPGADNSPHTISVRLTVADFPRAIMELNFEEAGGTIARDSSGNNNNGILYGGIAYTTECAVGSYALSFDGIDDYISCPGNPLLRPDDISVSLWVKHAKDTSTNAGGIIGGAYGSGYISGFRILDYGNLPYAQINFGDAEPIEMLGFPFVSNEWSHVVLTYDHSMLRLYQDGELVAEQPETRNVNWQYLASDLNIGLAQWYFNGLIDEVMIFGSALTPQMVRQLSWISSHQHVGPIQPRSPLDIPLRRLRESPQSPPSPSRSGMSRSPDILSASVMKGKNAPPQTFHVFNSGGMTLYYLIAVDQSWLSCFPANGTSTGEHDSITVSYSTASLSLGTHSATITISGSAASGSPQTIPISLTVTSFPEITEFNFEEGEGKTALDSSGNNNHGILYGGVKYTKDHAAGSYALSFDGINDRVVCRPDLSFRPDDFSVSLWVKHVKDTSTNAGGIIKGAYGNGCDHGFRILDHWNSPYAQINFGDARPIEMLGIPFVSNEWSHVVLTYDHSMLRLYQDGELVAEQAETRNINWQYQASDLSIGLAQWYFKGLIDKVMILSSALTAKQVQKLYTDR